MELLIECACSPFHRDTNAVDVAHQIHITAFECFSSLGGDIRLEYGKLLLVVLASIVASLFTYHLCLILSEHQDILNKSRECYKSSGLQRSVEKEVVEVNEHTVWGSAISLQQGTVCTPANNGWVLHTSLQAFYWEAVLQRASVNVFWGHVYTHLCTDAR